MTDWTITQQDFDRLLSWLDPDQNHAGKRYEGIRRKLILIFASRRWRFPEEMADDCINRVIKKLPEVEGRYQGPPEAYFYGVAKIIELEWRRKDLPIEIPDMEGISSETEEHLVCLDGCLSKLPDSSREVVMEYYQQEKQAKIDHRAALARKLGIAANALRIRAHRIRQQLEKCVLECLNQRALA
jgi:DNA-directed RNA polymerase specialized sigma24 family protein